MLAAVQWPVLLPQLPVRSCAARTMLQKHCCVALQTRSCCSGRRQGPTQIVSKPQQSLLKATTSQQALGQVGTVLFAYFYQLFTSFESSVAGLLELEVIQYRWVERHHVRRRCCRLSTVPGQVAVSSDQRCAGLICSLKCCLGPGKGDGDCVGGYAHSRFAHAIARCAGLPGIHTSAVVACVGFSLFTVTGSTSTDASLTVIAWGATFLETKWAVDRPKASSAQTGKQRPGLVPIISVLCQVFRVKVGCCLRSRQTYQSCCLKSRKPKQSCCPSSSQSVPCNFTT